MTLSEIEALAAKAGKPPFKIVVSEDFNGNFGARNIRDADGKWVCNASKRNLPFLLRIHDILALARQRRESVRYRSPTLKPVPLFWDGATELVGPAFKELDPKFHEQAEEKGCVSEEDEAIEAADRALAQRRPVTTKDVNEQAVKDLGRTSDPNPKAQITRRTTPHKWRE